MERAPDARSTHAPHLVGDALLKPETLQRALPYRGSCRLRLPDEASESSSEHLPSGQVSWLGQQGSIGPDQVLTGRPPARSVSRHRLATWKRDERVMGLCGKDREAAGPRGAGRVAGAASRKKSRTRARPAPPFAGLLLAPVGPASRPLRRMGAPRGLVPWGSPGCLTPRPASPSTSPQPGGARRRSGPRSPPASRRAALGPASRRPSQTPSRPPGA